MRKVCKRKIWPLLNPVDHAIKGAQVLDEPALQKLELIELMSIDAFARGVGTRDDWHILNNTVNMCSHFADQGIGPEAVPHVKAAQTYLIESVQAWKESDNKDVMHLPAESLEVIKTVCAYQDAQRRAVPRSQFESLIKSMRNLIIGGSKSVIYARDVK